MDDARPNRRWRNLLTLFMLGPVVALLLYATHWAFGHIFPLDRMFALMQFLAVGVVAGLIVAVLYAIYWFVDQCVMEIRRNKGDASQFPIPATETASQQ
jgi:hypothetical protein